jgi:outer membrane protein OmpA-like peptidoglycan-associated protein
MNTKGIISLILSLTIHLCYCQEKDSAEIYFDTDSCLISKSNILKLDSIITALKKNVNINIELFGYTDSTGSDKYNIELSIKRALNVKKYFIKSELTEANIVKLEGRGKYPNKNTPDYYQRQVKIIYSGKNPPTENVDTTIYLKEKPSEIINLEIGEIGEILIIKDINFIQGTNTPTKGSYPILDKIADILKKNPNLKIELQGHVCCVQENDLGGIEMSLKRAQYIHAYLVRHGIKSSRLKSVGFGSSRPLVKNEITDEDKAKNRRVGIRILEK